MNRHELDGAKAAIDSAYQLVDDCSEILVFFDVFSAGYCYLDEHNFSYPFRVFCKEYLECVKLLGNSFDIIESVDSNDQLYPFEFTFQDSDSVLD